MAVPGLVYALLAGLVPPLVWLFFWLREDKAHPEPAGLIAKTFLGGMLVVIIAIVAEQFIGSLNLGESRQYIWWAAIEEILKFIAVGAVALRTREYDEPIDAMIYTMTAALGFAALENTLFIMGPISGGSFATGLVTGNMRFIGSTLVHIVSSTIVGFGLGLTFYRSEGAKVLAWIFSMGAAIALHATFNITIVHASSADTLKTFGWVWGAVVIVIILFEEVKAVRPKLV